MRIAIATSAEVVAALRAMMADTRDQADARARTAGQVYSVRAHRRDRAHALNLAATWRG